jgi:hypothetical protein
MTPPCNRRVRPVKSIIRGMALATVAGTSLLLAGCGGANEAEAERLQKNLGAVPETTVKSDASSASVSRTTGDYGKRDIPTTTKNTEYEKGVAGGRR